MFQPRNYHNRATHKSMDFTKNAETPEQSTFFGSPFKRQPYSILSKHNYSYNFEIPEGPNSKITNLRRKQAQYFKERVKATKVNIA